MRVKSLIPVLAAAIAIAVTIYFWSKPAVQEDGPADADAQQSVSQPSALLPPSTSGSAGAGNPLYPQEPGQPAAAPLTSEQQEAEDARADEEQARESIALLHDPNPEKRVEGAAQLGAYTTPQSEVALVQALNSDPDAAVREAAAQSLVLFDKHSKATWNALLLALEDASPEVQSAAVATVDSLFMQYGSDNRRIDWVRDAIEKIVSSSRLEEDTRDVLQNIIDQREDAAER